MFNFSLWAWQHPLYISKEKQSEFEKREEMAANCKEEMESLLSNFDQIYEDFKTAISEIQLLRSSCNYEIKKREALEITCNSLKQENNRLTNRYTGSLENLADQLERRVKCQSLKEELKRVNDEHLSNEAPVQYEEVEVIEQELGKVIDSLKQEYATKIRDFEDQISGLLLEKATNEATINNLRQDLTAHKMHMQTLAKRLDQVNFDVETKYNLEIQDLKDCLLLEQEEKNELKTMVQDLEKQLLMSRTKMAEQNRDLASVRNNETLKLKIMTLRKENEILKRKLSSSEEI